MSHRIQTTYTPGRRNALTAMGDSLTHNLELGIPVQSLWPEVLATSLRAEGYSVRSRNFGHTGDTTTTMLGRVGDITRYDVPKIAFIGTGVNDVGTSFASTQANVTSMANTALAAGTAFVVVHGHHYENYTSIDTTSLENVNYAALRTALSAAVAAVAVTYPNRIMNFDTYAYFRSLIVAGKETQNSASWHIYSGNLHWNALGHAYMAAGLHDAIVAQSAWTNALL